MIAISVSTYDERIRERPTSARRRDAKRYIDVQGSFLYCLIASQICFYPDNVAGR